MREVLGSIPRAGDDTFVNSLNTSFGVLGVFRYIIIKIHASIIIIIKIHAIIIIININNSIAYCVGARVRDTDVLSVNKPSYTNRRPTP